MRTEYYPERELLPDYFYESDPDIEVETESIESLIDSAIVAANSGDCETLLNDLIKLSLQPGVNENDFRDFMYHIKDEIN